MEPSPWEPLVRWTLDASLWVQGLTGALGLAALVLAWNSGPAFVWDLLALELLVQALEFGFYWFVVARAPLAAMAEARYADWMLTTPVMLVTFSALLARLGPDGARRYPRVADFVAQNGGALFQVILGNYGMLAAGYLGETGVLDRGAAAALGFAGLGVSLAPVWGFAREAPLGPPLFGVLAGLWSAYGLGFLLEPGPRNLVFNGLDLVAKNFFGVVLAVSLLGGPDLLPK